MRAVVQRVSQASVSVDGQVIGQIAHGLAVLVGAGPQDDDRDARLLATKIANLRIFEDAAGKMNLSVLDVGGQVLAVSQFTLYADTHAGRRPSLTGAAPPEVAAPLIQSFCDHLRASGLTVATGRFAAMMMVEIHNEGPVTILLDTADWPRQS
ncbi:MAG: D-aminoacyl-tRNA deacylase [Chloroflexota bacterium]|nr:D-aminoacyl-tRNA deacylase [Chloroflexota bacterium]